ncbi:MAG: hypothetical protein V1835_02925 [Candidatus Micrarchaeota archaeon]
MKKVHLLRKFGRGKTNTNADEEKIVGRKKAEERTPPSQPQNSENANSLGFWEEERGQVSAEMLIIIAALIAVAIVLIGQLQSSAKTGAKNLGAKTDFAWKEIDKIGK